VNEFRAYRRGDLLAVAETLRPEDAREFAAVGLTIDETLEDYLEVAGGRLLTWDTEDGPVAVLGVTPSEDWREGTVWAVASTRAEARWRFAVRHTEAVLKRLSEGHLVLSNFKDARNTKQIAWLRRLGFVFLRKVEDFQGSGHAFYQFTRIAYVHPDHRRHRPGA
jgi:hypothetical protein